MVRKLPSVTFVAWIAVLVAGIVLFMRPSESPYEAVDAYAVSQHPPGSVTRYSPQATRFAPFYLVHTEDGRFLAVVAEQDGCDVHWQPLEQVFRNACDGTVYDREGRAQGGDHLARYRTEERGFDGVVVEMDHFESR